MHVKKKKCENFLLIYVNLWLCFFNYQTLKQLLRISARIKF